ncbi:hypothetical protein C8J56DRAFT_880147 [Mycena floridula]|nr:hypothetical protein C8J56DRAFT_880147 [Mycena floridula]
MIMTFKAFVVDLKVYALDEDWAKKVLTELMSRKLKSGSFATHSQDMVYLNHLLEGTPEHQDDTQMRSHVTTSVPPELHSHAFGITAATYDDWSSQLVKLIKKDYELSQHLALANPKVTATIQNAAPLNQYLQNAFQYQQPQHKNSNYAYQSRSNQNNYPNQNSFASNNQVSLNNQNRNPYASAPQYQNPNARYNQYQNRPQDNGYGNRPTSSFQGSGVRGPLQQVDKAAPNYDWPPSLKDPERMVLMDMGGCLGCHRVDVPQGHRAHNCDTPEHLCPHGSDYQPVTRDSAMRQLSAMRDKRPRETNQPANNMSLLGPNPKRA